MITKENIIESYSSVIEQTAVFPKTVADFSLAYFIIGLFDEENESIDKLLNMGETDEKALSAEFGDVLWYACGLCNYLGISFNRVINRVVNADDTGTILTIQDSNSMLGVIKKHYRDGKAIDLERFENCIVFKLQDLYTVCNEPNIEDVLYNNYRKLIQRRENNTIHGDGDNR